MKLAKNLLTLGLLLAAFAATAAPPAPSAEPPAATAAAPAETQPTDVFGSSILSSGKGDCGEKTDTGVIGLPHCGHCSPDPCANAELYSICGSDGSGELKRCIDDSGEYCRHSGPVCVCRTGPI